MCIQPSMDLHVLYLYVTRSKFLLSAVSHELRHYDVVEYAVNYELRNYYMEIYDCCPTVVEHSGIQYCPPKFRPVNFNDRWTET